jgi:hypothetical protein
VKPNNLILYLLSDIAHERAITTHFSLASHQYVS